MTLAQVAFALGPASEHPELADPVVGLEYQLAEDVIVRGRREAEI